MRNELCERINCGISEPENRKGGKVAQLLCWLIVELRIDGVEIVLSHT